MSSDNTKTEKSFIINDESFIDDKQSVITDLYTAIIYLNRFEKTQMNGGYIKIPYFMPSGTMRQNATYTENVNSKKYKCTNLYIFKATHNITMDAKFDGELVIELVPTVNTSEKLYLCFLLTNIRYVNREPNDIDKLIDISVKPPIHYETMNFTMQSLVVPKQKHISYNSGIDRVIIFLSPISINEFDFSNYATIPDGLFSIYPVNDDYKIIVPKKIEGFTQEGTGESSGSSDISTDITNALKQNLLTCEPVDDNDQSLVKDNTVTYLVDGKKDSSSSQNAFATAFLIMLVAIATSYFGAPVFFTYAIANYIETDTTLTLFTVFITFMLFLLGIILLMGGNRYDSSEMWVGVFIIIFLLLSSLSVALSRALDEQPREMASFSESATFDNFKGSSLELLKYFWNTRSAIKTTSSEADKLYIVGFFVLCIVIIIILSSVSGTLATYPDVIKKEKITPGYIEHLKSLIPGVGIPYGIIFSMWVVMAIKYS
jgi:hypothetical protein